MHKMDPTESMPFVAEALQMLRKEVGPETAVLGFVGCRVQKLLCLFPIAS